MQGGGHPPKVNMKYEKNMKIDGKKLTKSRKLTKVTIMPFTNG